MQSQKLWPEIQLVVETTSPNIAFRSISSHHHSTWARTFHSFPELYIQPQSIEEVQKLVNVARKCRRRVVVIGSGHSPSDLTCTSSWMLNLDALKAVVNVDKAKLRLKVQAGIRLRDLIKAAEEHGWTIPVLGSVDDQSLAGAISTGTHGSSIEHGLLSSYVKSLKIVLGNGELVECSSEKNSDLFRAALVSLGALGIIVEIEYQFIPQRNLEWVQTIMNLDDVLQQWNEDLWTKAEHTRIWWLPYSRRAIIWRGNKTEKALNPPKQGWYDGKLGYYMYKSLLWLSHFVPSLLPTVEWFVFGLQYSFDNSMNISAVETQHQALLMNCLYSQFVNEWAIPLSKGPKAISDLDDWINRKSPSTIPHANPRVWVHAPIEVRCVNSSTQSLKDRPFLDHSCQTEPTLYLNATLYRPAGLDPPCRKVYYKVFEEYLSTIGGRSHWAKNFVTGPDTMVNPQSLQFSYGDDLEKWKKVRHEVDPQGVFIGPWLRRTMLGDEEKQGLCEESFVKDRERSDGGKEWFGQQTHDDDGRIVNEESFHIFAKAELEA